MFKDVKEVCFSNNKMSDKQFADILTQIIEDGALFRKIQGITYTDNNEVGNRTLAALSRFLTEKDTAFPLRHLNLVKCHCRVSSLLPLLVPLNSKRGQLQSLAIPQVNLGEDCFQSLYEIIKRQSTLRSLDISRNDYLSTRIEQLFRALSDNDTLQRLNLAMIPVDRSTDLRKLK